MNNNNQIDYESNESIIVNDIHEYLIEISEIFDKDPKKSRDHHYLYRGQSDLNYNDLRAIIFRDELFSKEAEMISDAYSRRPHILYDTSSPFERLTKLQHYGLKTRLLDFSLNPLVALYFACCDVMSKDNKKTDGVVYVYDVDCKDYDSKEVLIHSSIAEMNIPDGIKIQDLITELRDKGAISSLDSKKYNDGANYTEFQEILKKDSFVISNLTNERLIQQSGAFFLPSCIDISDDRNNKIVRKVECKNSNDYIIYKFIIPYNNKEKLLNYLDYYNINKASLFPELEYQMQYISYINQKYNTKYSDTLSGEIITDEIKTQKLDKISINDNIEINKIIQDTISRWINDSKCRDDIYNIFENNMAVDWYKRDNILSKIRFEIKHYIKKSKLYSNEKIDEISNVILNEVISNVANDSKTII